MVIEYDERRTFGGEESTHAQEPKRERTQKKRETLGAADAQTGREGDPEALIGSP